MKAEGGRQKGQNRKNLIAQQKGERAACFPGDFDHFRVYNNTRGRMTLSLEEKTDIITGPVPATSKLLLRIIKVTCKTLKGSSACISGERYRDAKKASGKKKHYAWPIVKAAVKGQQVPEKGDKKGR